MSSSSNPANVPEDKMVTFVQPYQYAYTWEIQNFSTWQATVVGRQTSFRFPHAQNAQKQWVLEIEPRSTKKQEFCSLFLRLISPLTEKAKFEVEYELAMEDSAGCSIRKLSAKSDFGQHNSWGYAEFINHQTLMERIKPVDKLFIKCKITTKAKVVNKKCVSKRLPEPLPSNLSGDMKNLLYGEKFGDVTIQIGGQRFRAYKGILSARSSVFAAMFEHEMQETIENCVTIDDIEPDVFGQLLRYIYTDQLTPNCLNTMAHKLYRAADKYDLRAMKSLCRHRIMAKLSWKTAAETLVLADMHSDLEMKNATLQFLSGSVAAKVTETAGWKEMFQTHPHLINEAVCALAGEVALPVKEK